MNSQLTKSQNSYHSWSSTPTFCPVSECGQSSLEHVLLLFFPLPSMHLSCSPPAPAMEFCSFLKPRHWFTFIRTIFLTIPLILQQVGIPLTVAQHCSVAISFFWLYGVLFSMFSLTSGGTWWWLIAVHFCVLHKALRRGGTAFGSSIIFTHRRPLLGKQET